MANTVQIKRSAVPAKVPTTSDLQLGELAVNTYDGKLYLKKDDGTASIVEIGGGGGGGGGYFSATSLISTNTTATSGTFYVLTTAAVTLTLPTTPSDGAFVGVSNMSGSTTCIIARNGSNIMGIADNMFVDVVDAGFTLYYTGATYGWVII